MSLPIEDWDFIFPGLRMEEDFKLGRGNIPEKYDTVEYSQADLIFKV